MQHKSFEILDTKADADVGTFEATVAVFGNVDRGGDRIMRGAFAKSLAKWEASGDPIPVILSHSWDNPFHHIGVVEDVKETEKGLWVKGKLDVTDNDVARQVHRLMQRRSLKEFSFGYDVPKGGEKRAKDGANELLEVDVAEVGPTLKGMNPATELHAVKSALGVEEPPRDAETLRRETKRIERERTEEQLPKVTLPDAEVVPDPPAPTVDGVVEMLKALPETEVQTLRRALGVPEPKSASELREEAKRVEREVEQAKVPDVPETLERSASKVDVAKELQEVKTLLAETRQQLEDLKAQSKKADEADKEPSARSVDPLRKQAEAVALEFASGGGSLRKPPKTAAPKRPEPTLTLRELRQRTRDEMLGVLSGGITDE